jgi:hypothetical protein
MALTAYQIQADSTPQSSSERLELARKLFQRFHAQCFWHSPRDLAITEDLIPFVEKGLRTNGGRRCFVLSGKLRPNAIE